MPILQSVGGLIGQIIPFYEATHNEYTKFSLVPFIKSRCMIKYGISDCKIKIWSYLENLWECLLEYFKHISTSTFQSLALLIGWGKAQWHLLEGPQKAFVTLLFNLRANNSDTQDQAYVTLNWTLWTYRTNKTFSKVVVNLGSNKTWIQKAWESSTQIDSFPPERASD